MNVIVKKYKYFKQKHLSLQKFKKKHGQPHPCTPILIMIGVIYVFKGLVPRNAFELKKVTFTAVFPVIDFN